MAAHLNIDAPWPEVIRAALDQATTGSMDARDGALLLRTMAEALSAIWEGEIIPHTIWTRIAVHGVIAVLTTTADQLHTLSEGEE